jgi:predicted methyltransferase
MSTASAGTLIDMKTVAVPLLCVLLGACAGQNISNSAPPALDEVITGPHRTGEFAVRDRYRHPKETLEFFGLKPDMTVVEVWPGAGWYTEILAPYLRAQGRYYAAGFVVTHENAPDYRRESAAKFREKLAARPELYDRVIVTELGRPDRWQACPAGTADLVLTFRNVHNWMNADYEREMFGAFYEALKHGGTLGVVEHRAKPGTSLEQMKKSGYVTEEYVIRVAQDAGFRLVEKSEINANPKDGSDHPEGVWTLPPTLRLGDQDREKYLAIGESDRMTLRFVKPILLAPGDARR